MIIYALMFCYTFAIKNNSIVNTYDSKDRITSTAYAGKTYNYTYDINSQLTAVSGNNYSASYAYDSRGNIMSKTVNLVYLRKQRLEGLAYIC